ncbi:MAG TPA: Hsp70 family protein [Polyangiaceae bacterium]|nr:Hsp70 family protein [Polyangiaceae bacterium]
MSASPPLYVGIDLGTTNSAAAVFDGKRVELIRTAQGGLLTPSVVRIDARGKVAVGARARKLFEQDPENVRGEFKRLMGSGQTLHFPASGSSKKPEELAAEVLKSIREDIRTQLGFIPTCAVISVPALFELPQTAATSEAARLAGFERVEMIQEPVASGLGAGFRNDEHAGSYLVYDLGGGTFDASLLESREGLLRVVGHDGDNFLGGRDFDAVLLDHCIEQLAEQAGCMLDRSNPEHGSALRRLRAAAEDAKIELSRSEEADIFVAELKLGERVVSLSTTLSRQLLEQRVEPLIARSIAVCQRLLSDSGLPLRGGLARVILVGGPTVMPLLRRRVAEELDAPFAVGLDPMTLVAEGAAYYAASIGLHALGATPVSSAPGTKVWLQYPAMSSDLNPFVVGKLLDTAESRRITQVVVARGDSGWTSAPEPLDDQGSFAIMTSLSARSVNVFHISGRSAENETLPLSPGELTILHGQTLGDPPLSRSVGVALAVGSVRVFFERGCPLPARRTFALRSAEALSPADPEAALRVPIVQGEFARASLCRLVGSIEISAAELLQPLPANSLVEVTIELDRGGRLAASALISGSEQVFQHVVHLVAGRIPLSEIKSRAAELSSRHHALLSRALKHGAHKLVVRLSMADQLLHEAPVLEQSAHGGDADAEQKLQRLLIELDGLLSEAETELGWPDLDERAQRRIAWAVAWVGDLGTPEERNVLSSTLDSLRRARAAQNLKDVERHLLTVRRLGAAAQMREEGAWEAELDRCAGQVAEARDPKEAMRLVEEGRRAMKKDDRPTLERVVRRLWELSPASDEARKDALGSGVL